MNCGHKVVLHSYGRPEDTPQGVEFFDANRLMKESEIVRFSTGSLALASDIYRYRILKEGLGIYADCDMYCMKPIVDTPYILGWEEQFTVNGAILKVPSDSEMMKSLLAAAEDPYFIPPWLKKSRVFKSRIRKYIGFPRPVSKQQWGTIGPLLISHVVRDLGLEAKVSPIDVFYPLHHTQTSLLHERGLALRDIVTPRTAAIHFYNTANKNTNIMPDTPLYEIINS